MMVSDPDKTEKESMSPEEKLFKIIASGGKSDSPGPQPPARHETWVEKFAKISAGLAQAAARRTKQFFNAPFIKTAALQLAEKWKTAGSKYPSIKTTNKLLLTLIGFLALYLLADLLVQKTNQLPVGPQSSAMPLYMSYPAAQTKPVSYYLSPVQKRNMFLPLNAAAPAAGGAVGPVPETAPYKLVGISWDSQGYVAMIEEPGKTEAFFVRQGDSLPNGGKVQNIKDYSVEISLQDRKWELT